MERFNETISDDAFIKVYLSNYTEIERHSVMKSILTYGICQLNLHNDIPPSAAILSRLADKAKRMNLTPKQTPQASPVPWTGEVRSVSSFDNPTKAIESASKQAPKSKPIPGYDLTST